MIGSRSVGNHALDFIGESCVVQFFGWYCVLCFSIRNELAQVRCKKYFRWEAAFCKSWWPCFHLVEEHLPIEWITAKRWRDHVMKDNCKEMNWMDNCKKIQHTSWRWHVTNCVDYSFISRHRFQVCATFADPAPTMARGASKRRSPSI